MREVTRFASFLREKRYLQNVSTNTLRWYRHALNWLPSENPDERELKDMVVRMREAGLKATGCRGNGDEGFHLRCFLVPLAEGHAVKPLAVVLKNEGMNIVCSGGCSQRYMLLTTNVVEPLMALKRCHYAS